MDCYFNELSLEKAHEVNEARFVLHEFTECFSILSSLGINQLRLPEDIGNNLSHIEIADNYYIGSWLKDDNVDEVIRTRFRILSTTSPLLTQEELIELYNQSVFKVKDKNHVFVEAQGFGAAYLTNSLLSSLSTNSIWNTTIIDGTNWRLDDNANAHEEAVHVHAFSKKQHIEPHRDFIKSKLLGSLTGSKDVWNRRNEFFPNLTLCGQVKKQLEQLGSAKYLGQVIDRMQVLDSHIASLNQASDFSVDNLCRTTNLDVSGESDGTMRKYGHQRRFKIITGRYEYFELHIKLGDLRIHFFPDQDTKHAYIGYIGSHLDTISG